MSTYAEMVKQVYEVYIGDLSRIMDELYQVPFAVPDSFVDESSDLRSNYWKVTGVDGAEEKGRHSYMTGLNSGDWNERKSVSLPDKNSVLEYWRSHADDSEGSPLNGDLLDENGEHKWWQPSLEWVLNDLCAVGEFPAGDYLVVFD